MTTIMAFGQWQGAGERFWLAGSLARYLEQAPFPFTEISIDSTEGAMLAEVKHLDKILFNITSQGKALTHHAPRRLLTLSCECSGDIMPISYFLHRYPDLKVLWVDAHADLNTPQTSPSGDFHGMPLRVLLGEGPRQVIDMLPGYLKPHQLGLIGVRDCDLEERCYINSRQIPLWSELSEEDRDDIENFIDGRPLYIHLDLDVLDPAEGGLALFETPGGLAMGALIAWLESLPQKTDIVGIGLFEYNDPDDSKRERYARLVEICRRTLDDSAGY